MKRKYAGEYVKKYFPHLPRQPTNQQFPPNGKDNGTISTPEIAPSVLAVPPGAHLVPPGAASSS
jgi:hypothetical protein